MLLVNKTRLCVIFFLAFAGISTTSHAQDWDSVEIKIDTLSSNVFMLTGVGGNIGICTGPDGTFLIDAQYDQISERIVETARSLGAEKIDFVLNTHWHGDHVGGNKHLHTEENALIVAHRNVRKRMSSEQFMAYFRRKVESSDEEARPVVTFEESIDFHLNGEDILAFHVHEAHTDGDAIVFLPNANVIHMGDVFFKGRYPFIDRSSGGSIDGLISACERTLLLANEETQIIPGHGSLATKTDLKEYLAMLVYCRGRIEFAIESGSSQEEVIEKEFLKEYDDSFGIGFIKPNAFATFIYQDLIEDIKVIERDQLNVSVTNDEDLPRKRKKKKRKK